MEKVSNAPPTTRSSPNPDGVRQAPWQWERVYSAVKTCPVCGKDFHPNIWFNQNGKPVRCQMETDWKLRKYCSRECQSMARRQTRENRDQANQSMNWKQRARTAVKTCLCCGKEFRPRFYHLRPMSESAWNLQRFCSISCSKKVENPMFLPGVVEKMSETLKAIGHQPLIHGGNGRTLSFPQEQLAQILNAETEYPISTTAQQRHAGASHCYKLDVAIPFLRLGIQLDGGSHFAKKIRKTDKRIREWLAELGWSVLHISNSKALELCTICKSRDTLLSMLTESWFTTAI